MAGNKTDEKSIQIAKQQNDNSHIILQRFDFTKLPNQKKKKNNKI